MSRYRCGPLLVVLLAAFPVAPAWAQDVFANGFETPCDPGDADGDRLSGCQEKQLKTATDNPDTDDDGLSDGDEVLGTLGGLDLPGMGVNPRRKDILLEYDWFVDDSDQGMNENCPIGTHSHKPSQESLDMVTVMFGAAPVPNPNGISGVNVIHDAGQGGLFTGGSLVPDTGGDGVVQGHVYGDEYDSHYFSHFAAKRRGYFHYVLMAHRFLHYSGNNFSGVAEGLSGDLRDEMMVTLRCNLEPQLVARLIAHELGHNMLLDNGGDELCNGKPNYNSIMNYRYTWNGVDTDCDSYGNEENDFSRGLRTQLDENSLDESKGVCGNVPIDWNYDGIINSGVQLDLNPSVCAGTYSVLKDYNDWANIEIDMSLTGNEDGPMPEEAIVCPAVPFVPKESP